MQPNDPSFDEGLGKVPAWYRPALASAAPAYRRCWWPDDNRQNREWILSNAARLARAEAALTKRVESAHQVAFPTERIPVDVVPTVDSSGANTVVYPRHIVISSTGPGYGSFGGLELLFHEATHTVVSPRSDGGSIAAIRRAAEAERVEVPRDLWHVVLFYTAGEATKKTVREIWGEPYVQYLYTSGLFERAWPTLRQPLEDAWQPYLDGKSTLDEAASRLVTEIGQKKP